MTEGYGIHGWERTLCNILLPVGKRLSTKTRRHLSTTTRIHRMALGLSRLRIITGAGSFFAALAGAAAWISNRYSVTNSSLPHSAGVISASLGTSLTLSLI